MRVLKHLARDCNIDPHKLRRILRTEYGFAKGRRWTFNAKEEAKVKKFLEGRKP